VNSRDRLRELRALSADLKEYDELLNTVWNRAHGGEGWWSAGTLAERDRVAELQEQIALRYGRVRTAVIAANGAIPIIGNAYATGGEAVPLAISDPSTNPWFPSVLEMSRELITRTIGHYEAVGDTWVERTSVVFWARFAARPIGWLWGQLKDFGASIIAKIIKPG